jgi:hypothetical protein
MRVAASFGLVALALAVAVPFFTATTFIGDDHVFLAFARHAPNPLVAFVSDQHGGEYYRPWPMLVWWLLGRAGGGSAPFAALALALHLTAAGLVAALVRACGRPPSVAVVAAALMLLAPQNLEAAYWYAASTDLFATVFVLASLLALVRGRPIWSTVAAVAAYLSKESALVLPVLALVVLYPRRGRAALRAVAPLLLLAALVVAARISVLGGWGGAGEAAPSPLGRALQLTSGLAHLFTGPLPEPIGFAAGTAAIVLTILAVARRRGEPGRFTPFLLTAAALAPLGAAGWVIGARYFYLPAVGLAWGTAEALSTTAPAARAMIVGVVTLLGIGQTMLRRPDIVSYDRRVAAARRAVASGARDGHRVFHIDGGIKDLDLAVKEDPSLVRAGLADHVLVLNDVPASFAIVPADLHPRASALLATPPLPPSGGYRFGGVRVVGLARRGDEPTLDEALAMFPDLRFVRLRPTPGGAVIARDVTDAIKRELVPAAADDDFGQD